MGFLKSHWHRKYQFLVVTDEGGRTRSVLFKGGQAGIVLFVVVLVIAGVIGGWVAILARMSDYREVRVDNQRLSSYRDKVQRVVLNSAQYGLVGVDLLKELELAIDLGDTVEAPGHTVAGRQGGIFIDQVYINFLENIPTYPPVNGYVTRGLMLHELDLQVNHEGIDIAAPAGEIVSAAASGLVVLSRWTEDLGYMIILSHGDGYFTIYGHNQTNLVAPRQWVERGQPIGLVGDTGISQGPHLHFEIWKDARSIDPRLLIDLYRKQDISVETHG